MVTKLKFIALFILLLLPLSINAWSSVGHKVVAHIAYDHLTPEAKKAVDGLTAEPEKKYSGRSRFVYGSTWADWSRDRGDTRFRLWHYIDLPLAPGGEKTKQANPINAVYGINHCQAVLKNAQAGVDEKKTCLKLLVHLVGDIHQPLHAVSRFSLEHPQGDRGGNRYRIRSKVADSLHAYWDRGLGKFKPFLRRNSTTGVRIWQYAEEIQERYPIERYSLAHRQQPYSTYLSDSASSQDKFTVSPIGWAREGRALSASFVYKTPENTAPSREYHDQGVPIMEERLALAGYRLAALLNTLYNHSSEMSKNVLEIAG